MSKTLYTRSKNLEIERLRAIAVIMITVAHGIFSNLFPEFALFTFYGVDLFFAISGFVVTVSFLSLLKNVPEAQISIRIFYLKRMFRIVPLAFFWMLAFLFLAIFFEKWGGGGNFNQPYRVLLDIFGITTGFYNYFVSYGFPGLISHYWTLATEMQFYAVLPIVFIVFKSRKNRVKTIFILIGTLFLLRILFEFFSIKMLRLIYEQRYFTLLFGVLIGLYHQQPNDFLDEFYDEMKKYKRQFLYFFVPGLLMFLWIFPGFSPRDFFNGLGFIIAGVVSTFLVFIASKDDGLILEFPVLKNILEYIGSRSYGIYLCHLHFVRLRPTLLTLFHYQLPEWFKTEFIGVTLQYLLIWVAMIVSSEILFRLLERPFMNLGKAYINQYVKKS